MTTFEEFCDQMQNKIVDAYTEGVTLDAAERMAGEFLHAMLLVSVELKKADLNSRMHKTGLKSICAAIYMEAATKADKKPSDVMLQAMVDLSELVVGERNAFDQAEAEKEELERYYNIFREAHIFMRGVSRGRMD